MKVWFISDTHNGHEMLRIPAGVDMVIHSGDCAVHPIPEINYHEVSKFFDWFSALPIEHKIFVPGNHDTSIEHKLISAPDGVVMLIHDSITINGINIFGSPYTPLYNNWAFMVPRSRLPVYWSVIPNNTDILITHGPPYGILDQNFNKEHCGCDSLWKAIRFLDIKYHVFGHIHEQAGRVMKLFDHPTTFINASVCGMEYVYENNGYVVDIYS